MIDLSPRQRQILRMIATGANCKEIAARIGSRPATVRGHIRAILWRLQARSQAHAVFLFFHR